MRIEKRASLLVLAAAGLACTAVQSYAATTSLGSVKDNSLMESTSEISGGAGPDIIAGVLGFNGNFAKRRGVMQFNVSAIPAFSFINSASLTLTCSQSNANSGTFEVHKLLASWGEGSTSFAFSGNGSPANDGDATWDDRFYNADPNQVIHWTNLGGDFAPAISASTTVGFSGTYTWSGSGLSNDVQSWIDDPSNNFGLLLKADEVGTQNAKKFFSRESSTGAPVLAIQYFIGGDANGDDMVDLTDFTFLAANFNTTGKSHADGDFDHNGTVDLTDFTILASNFNKQAPAAPIGSTVPEPVTIPALFATLALGLRARRNK
jgi:hypothetical protein